MTTIESTPPDQLDFTEGRTFDDPWERYRWLRDNDPIHRDEANDLYVVSRYEDVYYVSSHNELFCNKYGVRPKVAGDMSLIAMDGPEHLAQRRLVRRGFTPRQVRKLIPHVRDLANQIIDEVGERGEIDFVEDLAIHVPLIVICELMGLDPDARLKMYRWSDDMMAGDGATDPDDPRLIAAAAAFGEYAEMCEVLIEERRQNPEDDLISILTQAYDEGELEKEFMSAQGIDEEDFGGEPMETNELLLFLTIALVAGNETTRNAISGGMKALSEFPDERQRLLDNLDDDEFVDLAVDELIRYVSPVMGFMRTLTQDHTYKGVDFKEGDRVLMLYQSANRDERQFDDPDQLILDRDPNPHIAFGYGVHFCLGANLARMEVKVVFQELFRRLCDIKVPEGAEVEREASALVLALSRLPATFTPESECPVPH